MPPEPPAAMPLFVISFNRAAFLRQVCDSYRRLAWPVRLVIHDNGSFDRATLDMLAALAAEGAEIVRHGRIITADDLNLVDATVQAYCRRTGYTGPYVVTDCDIDLSVAQPDVLQLYQELLERFPAAECVGPMLRIADVPRRYTLFGEAMARHIDQFWQHEPKWAQTSLGRVAVLPSVIDTSLAVHRGGSAFRRLKAGLRVYHPYEARHLDWYPQRDATDVYRRSSSPLISHWDNDHHRRAFAGAQHPPQPYRIVVGAPGDLRVVTRSTADNPE